MRKLFFLFVIFAFNILGISQTLNTEYHYLALIKNQPKPVVKDNLRNAEMVADSLWLLPVENPHLAALYFMELGNNYAKIKQHEMAIFSFFRQRFFFPFDSISIYVENQIREQSLFLNLDKQQVDILLQKSNTEVVQENKYNALDPLLCWIIKFENKRIENHILHHLELMQQKNITPSKTLLKWQDLTKIGIKTRKKRAYLSADFNQLTYKQQSNYIKHLTKFFIRHKSWSRAKESLNQLNKIKPGKKYPALGLKTRICLKF
ncbi:MAG: hypothetical protein JW857_08280 [Bacteroidales bacterium]|nr:hypothetical protein [Bacteroidales bacterium]